VQRSQTPLEVSYTSGLDSSTSVYRSICVDPNHERENLDIRVLSPAFFSRMIHYTHISRAFDQESIFTDEKNRTITVSRPDLLASLSHLENQLQAGNAQPSVLDHIRWSIQQRLRCPPSSSAYLLPMPDLHTKDLAVDMKNISHVTLSSLDYFVQSSCKDDWVFRRLCTRLFIGQRFFGGFSGLVHLSDILLRLALVFIALRTSFTEETVNSEIISGGASDAVKALLMINAANLWAGVKGCGA
jgi:hypothetical protein